MAKRGRKALPRQFKILRGTDQKCRRQEPLFPKLEVDDQAAEGLDERIRAIWERKLAKYEARGQSIGGFEDALLMYCALEAALMAMLERGKIPTASLLAQYRHYAQEFFDTPASALGKIAEDPPAENPFSKHGRPPKRRPGA